MKLFNEFLAKLKQAEKYDELGEVAQKRTESYKVIEAFEALKELYKKDMFDVLSKQFPRRIDESSEAWRDRLVKALKDNLNLNRRKLNSALDKAFEKIKGNSTLSSLYSEYHQSKQTKIKEQIKEYIDQIVDTYKNVIEFQSLRDAKQSDSAQKIAEAEKQCIADVYALLSTVSEGNKEEQAITTEKTLAKESTLEELLEALKPKRQVSVSKMSLTESLKQESSSEEIRKVGRIASTDDSRTTFENKKNSFEKKISFSQLTPLVGEQKVKVETSQRIKSLQEKLSALQQKTLVEESTSVNGNSEKKDLTKGSSQSQLFKGVEIKPLFTEEKVKEIIQAIKTYRDQHAMEKRWAPSVVTASPFVGLFEWSKGLFETKETDSVKDNEKDFVDKTVDKVSTGVNRAERYLALLEHEQLSLLGKLTVLYILLDHLESNKLRRAVTNCFSNQKTDSLFASLGECIMEQLGKIAKTNNASTVISSWGNVVTELGGFLYDEKDPSPEVIQKLMQIFPNSGQQVTQTPPTIPMPRIPTKQSFG